MVKNTNSGLMGAIVKHLFINAFVLLVLSSFFFLYNSVSGDPFILNVPSLLAIITPALFFNIWYNKRISYNANVVIDVLNQAVLSKNYLESVIKVIPSFVVMLDIDFKIISFNESILKMLGYEKHELERRKITDIIGELNSNENLFSFFSDGPSTLETTLVSKSGKKTPILLSIVKLVLTNKISYGYICAAQDISLIMKHRVPNIPHAEHTEEMQYIATHDPLTGLSNRLHFESICSNTLERILTQHRLGALFYIDIDQFRDVNNAFGHAVGDEVLKIVATRLKNTIRGNDCAMHQRLHFLAARTGGDEYLVLTTDLESFGNCSLIARRLMDSFEKGIRVDSNTINISVSIGIAPIPYSGKDFDTIVKNAHMAMCQAKHNNMLKYQYFNDSLQYKYDRRVRIIEKLKQATVNNSLYLAYQPIFDIHSQIPKSFEALLRWNEPTIEHLNTEEFIFTAEETGLILEIGYWIIHKVCSDYIKLGLPSTGCEHAQIAVNLSPVQLNNETFVKKAIDILNDYRLSPKIIEFEVTESTIMKESDVAINNLMDLHELGFNLSIDDFGTGLSSLSRLEQLPIDTLKIDKSFIDKISETGKDNQVIDLIINLGRFLGMNIIAEGIMEPYQLEYLRKKRCTHIQGYLLSEPLPFDDLMNFIKQDCFSKSAKP